MSREQDDNLLRHEGIPTVFSNRALAGDVTEGVRRLRKNPESMIALGELELAKLKRINHVLEHPELQPLIKEGKLTLGIIKPQANKSTGLTDHDDDQEAADKLIDEIKQDISPGKVIFSFSTKFSGPDAEKFYQLVKKKFTSEDYKREHPEDPEAGPKIWQSIYDFAQSGPLTFLLLYRESGDAVEWWRKKMGETNPSEAGQGSIRGDYALKDNLPNNLVHGSDLEKDSVRKELDVLKAITGEMVMKSVDAERIIPREETIKNLKIIPQDSEVLAVECMFNQMRDESWIYGYQVIFRSQDQGIHRIFFKEKNNISMGGDNQGKAERQSACMDQFKSLEIPQPKKYGLIKAAIYQEWIVNDQREAVVEEIRKGVLDPTIQKRLLDQLIFIGKTLDQAGFFPLDFIKDLIFDADKEIFLYIDFGFDLGASGKVESQKSLDTLLTTFPQHERYILEKYPALTG